MNHSNTTLQPGEPCRCGEPAIRTIGTIAFCDRCAEVFLGPIRRRVEVREIRDESGIGSGSPLGARPDMGPTDYNLECTVCTATWVGEPWELCSWCITRVEAITDAQRAVVLHPDLPPGDDPARVDALKAWAPRLAHAVKAGYITEHEARAAWHREVVVRAA